MAYGIQVANSAGTITFDSNVAGVGCMVDVLPGQSGSFTTTYPNFPGRSAIVVKLNDRYSVTPTVDYALGYPRVTFPGTTSNPLFAVFII